MTTTESHHGQAERRILTGMIVSPPVLARIAARWDKAGLFASKWANLLGHLCVRYHQEYGTAPGRAIEAVYEAWANQRPRDPALVQTGENFLVGLSNEYTSGAEINPAHLLDRAGDYFRRVRLKRHADELVGLVDVGEVAEAERVAQGFVNLNLGTRHFIDVLQYQDWDHVYDPEEEALVTLSDGLGKFFSRHLQRGNFFSFLAPEKVGKTTWLTDLAWRAQLQRRRVAYFALGDESEDQMMRRFGQRAAQHPRWATAPGEVVKFPVHFERAEKESRLKYDLRREGWEFSEGMTARRARAACAEIRRKHLRSNRSFLRLMVYPAGELSVQGMEAQLAEWSREGWDADVVVGDYMENLRESGNPRDDPRFRIAATWADMRGLALRRHVLVLTATQANKAGGSAELLTREHFSESKTKLAHVTGMAGINQSEEEKLHGVQRLNWIVLREAMYLSWRQCYCAGNFAVQHPAMRSFY